MYLVIQILCLFLALVALGQAISKSATRFDKVAFSVLCVVFIILTTYIEGVLK